jgi:hypothetical protein
MHWWHKRRLSGYLDGALAARAKARLDRHLEGCEECRTELAELRGTVLLLRTLALEEDEDEFLPTRVLARIAAGDAAPAWADRARDAVSALLSGAWAPAISAVAVLFVVATMLRVQVDIRLPSSPAPAAPPTATPVSPPLEVASAGPLTQEIRLVQTPVHSRRRFDPVVLEIVSGVHRACAASPHDAECQGFRNNLVNLALGDPPDFVREIESFPPESRDRVLRAVSLEAARTGHSQRVIRGLRSVDDPRVFGIVVHFQRTIASRE